MSRRVKRLNSLLKEVISDVVIKDVRHPDVSSLITITDVDITSDLRHAKVYVSVIGTDEEKKKTIDALNTSSGYIAVNASKQVVLRYFPELIFKLDDSIDKHMKIESIIHEIEAERSSRGD